MLNEFTAAPFKGLLAAGEVTGKLNLRSKFLVSLIFFLSRYFCSFFMLDSLDK